MCAAAAAVAMSGTAQAATEQEVLDAVAQAIPGAQVDPQQPVEAAPPPADLAAGRAETMMDPAFWTQVVTNALEQQAVVIPSPVDVVRPEMYLPTVPVRAGGKRTYRLPRRDRDLDDLTYEFGGRTKTLREFMNSTETDGVAFVHKGRIVDDLYANGWSSEDLHQPWSVTKSFISTVVGIAVDEGRIRSLQDPIDRYITELKGTAWEGTTIQNLLEMESGVHWDESTPVLAVNTQVEQWIQAALDLYSNGQLGMTRNEFLKSLPRVAPQGTKFSYNSGNTQVLAWLTETIYGKEFNEVISEKLWKPAGMAADAKMMTDRVGDVIASQGLYSRIFDLARFGELFRNEGRTTFGRQIVSRRWVRQATARTALSEGQYAFQWWQGATPDAYTASGFQGNKITVSPKNCLTGVRLSHTFGVKGKDGKFDTEFSAEEWNEVFRTVAKRLGGC
jgi:CubicO group peptidase (beta-lactamase class C family)